MIIGVLEFSEIPHAGGWRIQIWTPIGSVSPGSNFDVDLHISSQQMAVTTIDEGRVALKTVTRLRADFSIQLFYSLALESMDLFKVGMTDEQQSQH